MSYYFTKTVSLSFEETLGKVTDELKKEGFGVLTEIDVKDTLKSKLGVEFRSYRILGACYPPFAYRALQAEDKIGLLLPCNVVVQDKGAGLTEVSVINPVVTMKAVQNPELGEVAEQVRAKLQRVIDRV
jgi:uncharacterized protein (DUF302 family)